MPSSIISARSVSSTRSLKVPGSPSSALQMMVRLAAGVPRASSHLRPVGKPAPPRPRSFERVISSITSCGVIVIPWRSAEPGSKSASSTGPRWRMLLRTIERTSGWALLPSPITVTSCGGSR